MGQLPNLQTLKLCSCPINGTELKHLKGLTNLRLEFVQLGDEALSQLQGCEKLRWLDLASTSITDESIPQLKKLDKLLGLDVSWTKITDAAVSHIKEMKSLTILNLHHTQITDAALPHLISMEKLEILHLAPPGPGQKVTKAAIAKLRRAMPNVKINVY